MGDRLAAAKTQALHRRYLQQRALSPFRFAVIAVVVVVAVTSPPHPSLSGRGLGITICLVVFGVGMAVWPVRGPRSTSDVLQISETSVLAGTSVALAFLQPHGTAELPGSAVVFIAGAALVPPLALGVGAVVTLGICIGLALTLSASSVVASVLLCAVLGVTGSLVRRARISQDHTELLLAELEEARDEQARSAALAERASIARELHDVLAHSLSGLAIQLEGARQLATSEQASTDLQTTIDAAATLAKQGLIEARNAVSTLRHDVPVTLAQIPVLVEHFRRDLGLSVEFSQSGTSRVVASDVSVALYSATREALTNVTRYAAGATTHVKLTWEHDRVLLSVVDEGGAPLGPHAESEGGGWGLVGMRERVSDVDGHMKAGPFGDGWVVEVTVPA